MDLPWGDERTKQFITNVGLITTDGPYGPNVMACEWTHQVSYSPGLIAVCIGHGKATYENIKKTAQFGVNICSTQQSILSSVAGSHSGKNIDKIKALQELGFKFYKAKTIKSLMIEDSVLNIECKLFKNIPLGDHTMFVGKISEITHNSEKEPLAYHKGNYWIMNTNIQKPSDKERERIKKIIEKYKK